MVKSIESWIVRDRRNTCLACAQKATCTARHTIFDEQTACPLHLHPARADAIAERAWPSGVAPAAGCCDHADPGQS